MLTITLLLGAGNVSLNDGVGTSDNVSVSQAGNDMLVSLGGAVFAVNSSALSVGVLEYRNLAGLLTSPANNDAVSARVLNVATTATVALSSLLGVGNDSFSIATSSVSPLRLTSVTVSGEGGLDSFTIGAGGLHLNAPGLINQRLTVDTETIRQSNVASPVGSLDATGDVTLTNNAVGGGQILFQNTSNTFGGIVSLEGTGNTVQVGAASNVRLGDVTANSFALTVINKNVTQVAGTSVLVTGLTNVSAGTGNVTLTEAGNDFATISTDGGDVIVTDPNTIRFTGVGAAGSLVVGALTVRAPLVQLAGEITATDLVVDTSVGAGGITDLNQGMLTISGSTTMSTQPGDDIRLSRPVVHNLNGAAGSFRVTQTRDLVVDDAGDLNIDADVLGTATITTAGALTDAATGDLVVSGLTTIAAGGDITLDSATSDFSTVRVNSGVNTVLVDLDDLTLTFVSVTGDLDATGSGLLSVTGDISALSVLLTAAESTPTSIADNLLIGFANVQTTTGQITLEAADNLIVDPNALVSAAQGAALLTINLDTVGDNDLEGGTFLMDGNYLASRVDASGGDDDDTINLANLATATSLVQGNDGNDFLRGGDLADTILGGNGNDTLDGDNGADSLDGGANDDNISAGLGNDVAVGGSENDFIDVFYEAGNITVDAGSGDDIIAVTDRANGQLGTVTINAGAGDDQISGSPLRGAALVIDGGMPPTPSSPGDALLFDLTSPALGTISNPGPDPTNGNGSISFSSMFFGSITYFSIEDFVANSDPNPVFDGDGRVNTPDLRPVVSRNDGTADTFSVQVVNGAISITDSNGHNSRLPTTGLQSIRINGSNDSDSLVLDQSAQTLVSNLVFDGKDTGVGQDILRLIGGVGVNSVSFRPTGTALGDGVLTLGSNATITIAALEDLQLESLGSVTVTPTASQNSYHMQHTTDLTGLVSAIEIASLTAGVNDGRLRLAAINSLTLDLGFNDGATPNDILVVENNTFFDSITPANNVATLQSVSLQTGAGTDRVTLNESDFRLPTAGGVFVIDGGNASDTLQVVAQADGAETGVGFTLASTTATQGSLTSNAGGINTTISLLNFTGENAVLTGNASNNQFDLSGWSRLGTATIDGLGGNDALTALDVAGTTNLWNISGPNSGSVGGFDFLNVENLNGGNTANDVFVFGLGGSVSGNILAGGGNDTLNFTAYTTPVTILLLTADPVGHIGSYVASGATGSFAGIDTVSGSASNADMLNGRDINQTWGLDGTDSVTDATFNRTLAFTSFEILTGGTLNDIFEVTGTQAHRITGIAGDDTLQFQDTTSVLTGSFAGGIGSDTLDYRNYGFARTVNLTGNTVTGFFGTEAVITEGFTGVDRVIGGSSAGDTLVGLNVASQWIVNGANQGSYSDAGSGAILAYGDATDGIGIRGFETLIGGTDFDTFRFINLGTLGGNIDGGSSPPGATLTTDTIVGDDARLSEDFTIDGINAGTFKNGPAPILGGRYNNVETLIGGSGADTFTFTNTGVLDGPVDGVGGMDTIIGDSDGNVFNVTQTDAGQLVGKANRVAINTIDPNSLNFSNMENIIGGLGNDTFNVQAVLVGSLAGQAGNDLFTFSNAGSIFGTLNGGAGADSLVGDAGDNLFNLFGGTSGGASFSVVGRGSLATKTSLFTEIENLDGSEGNDSFLFNDFGSVTGTVIGGSGNDIITGDDDGNFFNVTAPDRGALLGKMTTFNTVENLVGGGGNDTFNINSNLSGNITGLVGNDTVLVATVATVGGNISTGELNDTIDVRGRVVGAVDAGIGDDGFILQGGATIDGLVTGNGGRDTFLVTGSVTLGFTLRGGADGDTFTFEIAGSLNQHIDGESGSDTIVGDSDGNLFTISAGTPNSGTLPGHGLGTFSDIENLTGGAAADTFAINANLDGSISGLAGNDVVTLRNAQSIGGSITGGDGNDSITVGEDSAVPVSGAHVEGNIDGGNGMDVITIKDRATGSTTTVVRGGNEIDTLTVDYSGSVSRVFVLDLGTNAPVVTEGDQLNLTGTFTAATTTYSVGAFSTSGDLTTTNGAISQQLTFIGAESINNALSTGGLIVNASDRVNTVSPFVADTINIVNAATAGFTSIDFNGAYAPIQFRRTAGLIVTVNGAGGSDTININNPNPASPTSVLNVNGNGVSNLFDSLSGADGGDTINIRVSHTGSVTGGAGNDRFVYTNGARLSGNIDGDEGTDTIDASVYTTALSVTLGAETFNGFSGTESALLNGLTNQFIDIDSIRGSTGIDSINNGTGFAADWDIDGTDQILVNSNVLSYSAFELLNGGVVSDRFNISGTRAATITGGAGGDELNFNNGAMLSGSFNGGTGADVVSFAGTPTGGTPYTTSRSIVLTANATDGYTGTTAAVTGGFTNVDSLVGGAAADTLTGLDRQSTWELDGSNRYIDQETAVTPRREVGFSAIETLTGLSRVDTFLITGNQSNTLNGAGGDDLFQFTDGANTNSITIDGGTESDVVTFSTWVSAVVARAGSYTNVEEIIGGTNAGDRIESGTADDVVVVSDTNEGQVNGVRFSAFENVNTNVGNDLISFVGTGALTGSADGDAGTDTLDLSGLPGTLAAALSAIGAIDGFNGTQSAVGTFANINTLTGKGSDSLTGLNGVATWTISTSDTYTSAGRTLDYSGFTTLDGGTNNDTFQIDTSTTRTIQGNDGNDIVAVKEQVTLTGDPSGGAGNDQFNLGTNSVINGAIDGGLGNDTLAYMLSTTPIMLTVGTVGTTDGFQGTALGVSSGFDNIDTVGGSAATTDTIIGRGAASIWDIDGTNSLASPNTYTDTVQARSLDFFGIENLNAGNQSDRFNVAGAQSANLSGNAGDDSFFFNNDAARLTGTLAGGLGNNDLSFAGLVSTLANVTLTGNTNDGFAGSAGTLISAGFTGIDAVTGGAAADTITGQNLNATWFVELSDTYRDNATGRILTFASYENLTGGSSTDTFLINAALAGTVSGLGGNDVVDVQATGSVGGDILTGDGIDEIFLHAGAGFGTQAAPKLLNSGNDNDIIQVEFAGGTERYFSANAGSGNDELRLLGGEPAAAATSSGLFAVGPSPTQGTVTTTVDGIVQSITFDGFTPTGTDQINDRQTLDQFTVQGSTAADTINLVDGIENFSRVNFNNAFMAVEFQKKTKLQINGVGNADTINLNNPNRGTDLGVVGVDGGDGNDTINVLVNHVGNLTGGNGDDRFAFADTITLTGETPNAINGGSGVDTVDLSGWTTTITTNLLLTASTGFSGSTIQVLPTVGNEFRSIDRLVGSTAADQLIGLTGNATWQINGANAYVEDATNRSVGFSSYEVLKGNAGNDTFRISGAQTVDIDDQAGSNTYAFVTNDAQLTGGIIGGAGNDTLDFSGIASAGVAVELTSFALGVGFNGSESRIRDGFLAINSLRGSANSDTLTGINTASSWTVSNAKSYRVDTEILTFTNIELAVGGSDVDTFRVIGTQTLNIVAGAGSDTVIFEDGALLNGTADGGDPTTLPGDVLDFALYTTPREVDLSAYTNFETVLSGTPSDTLIGTSGNDFFEISGPGSGKINGLGFSGFANLDGLAGNDSFTFTTGIGSLLGRIEGGSGTDSLSFSGVGASVDITLGGASLIDGYDGDDAGTLLAGFSNINSLAGGASADSLLGLNVDSTWVVATNGSYTANGLTLGLTSFEVLNGQSGDDTYNVSGTATATLNGSDGADVVTLANTAQLIGDINLGADNDRLSLGDAAVLTGSVEFFSGNDTLNLSGTVTAQSIGLTSLGVASGFDGALVALNGGISGGFFGLETLIGGSGDDLLQGLDTVAAWTIGASSTYVTGGQSLVFSGINNAVGGIDIDTFTVVSSATIDLAGNSGADIFNVNSNAVLTGTLSGDGGDDVFSFTGVIAIGSTVIDGGFGFDTLDLSSGITGVSLNLDNAPNLEIVTGTSSTDTLVGTTGDDVFNILGTDNAGSTGSLNFTSFEHLRGNSGNDQFVFADGLGVTGSVDGGLGSDTVDYSAYTTAVSVNFVTNLGTNIDGGVTTVENATGGSGNDSLTGNTLGNTLIGGLGNDVLTDGFGNDSLDGGDGDDQYVLTPGSADIATDSSGVDVLDFSNSAGPISINLDSVSVQTVRATHTLQLSGVFENFIGTPLNDSVTAIDLGVPRLLDGRLGSDTFRTGANIANNWTVTAANQGVLGNTNFTQIENLVGGNNDDTFVFANGASVAGSIDGGGQAIRDTVNYGPATTALNISLSSLISIESLIGGGGQDTLTGTNSNTAYTINNADAGAVGTLAFSGVENIAAGTGTDSFTFTTNGFLTGSVNGGAGANTLTLSNLDDAILLTSPATVGFNGSVAAVTGFANVTSVNGGLGFDTLTGDDAVASWGIDGSNDYQSAGKTLAISDVENLVGGAGDDTFAVTGTQTIDLGGGAGNDTFSFADGSVLNGQLNGGLGTDKLLLIGSNNRSVSLGITGSEDGFAGAASFNGLPITTFDNLNSVQGGSGSDTLTGTGEAATVVLSPLGNTYSDINGTLAFSSIRGLVTGSLDDVFQISGSQTLTISSGGGDDSFRFLTSNAAVNGTIDGGDGTNDRLDYSAVTTAISASVANLVAIERVIGGASAADTLNGGIAGSTFSVTANRAGSLDGVAFSGFETLAGASGADTFNIVDGGAVLAVSGGSGNDTLNWGGTSTARSVTLNSGDLSGYSGTEASVGQFSGIDTLAGSSGATTDALTGLAADAIWTVGTAADRSYVSSSRVLTFRNFEMLTGGSLVDTFNVTGSTTATINAGAGNDRIVLSAGAVLTGSVQGGAGTDTLDTTAISGAAFTLVSAGSTDGFNVTFGNVTGTVSNLNTIIAGSGADTVTGTAQPANWTIGTSDTYVVPPPPPAPALPPLSTRSITLTGIETRIGGSGIDTFNVQANSLPTGTQVLNGGAGGDVFNLNFAATTRVATGTTLTLIGGLSAAQLTNSDVVNINATAVGDGVRSIGLTYAGSAAGNVNVSGLGGAANNIALLTIEKLNLNGDSANNDTVTVTGTAAADQLTVSPSSNGGSVLLNGSGLGVAGGSTGPDIVVAGISTNGFNVSGGGPTTIPGDSLRYNGTGMITINTSTSGSFSQTGGVNLAYSNIEDLNPVNSLIFNINALASANNGVADTFLLSLVAGRVDVAVNGTTLLNEDPADIAGLIISGSSDDDALTVNFSGGIPTPATGVTFVGAGQTTGDSLTVIGTAASVATFRPSGTTNGTGTLTVDGAVINHTGVEPVTGNTLASLTLVTPNDADLLTVSSPVVGQSRITGTSGAVGFSPVNFAQVATVILDAATNGTAAADRVTFTSDLLATGLTSFQIATAGGADTINAATVVSRGVSINAGAGNDTITGGGGNDSINGGLGTDTISQTVSGTQLLTNTSLTGAGTDALTGIETASLSGSAGNDTINASTFTGTTILSGLAGNDTITGGSAVDVIHGGDGDDSVLSGDGNDTIFGGIGNDVLNGGLGNDSVLGEVGLDSVSGGLGDDFVNGGDNFDTLVEVGGRTVTLTNIALTGLGTDVLANIETANLTLNSLGGTLNAAGFTVSQGTTLTGGSGNDTITGTAAVDLINGGAGNDIITAGDGNDFVYGGAGNDQINGGLGNDVLRGNAGNDLLTGDVGNDNIDGGLGDDQLAEVGNVNFVLTNTTLTGLGNDSLLSIELAALVGGAGANTIDASAFSGRTTLNGGAGNDIITGGGANDLLLGMAGADVIVGGTGNDTITGGADNDAITGGDGTDTITATIDGNITLTSTTLAGEGLDTFSTIEAAVLTGGASNNTLSVLTAGLPSTLNGGDGDDVLIGGALNDLFNGGAGIDSISASGTNIVLTDVTFTVAGSDQLVGIENVRLTAGATASLLDASGYTLGSVTLIGGAGDDTLIGGTRADSIVGNGGNDTLVGNGGDDTIFGGIGLDSIRGGDGNDVLNGEDNDDVLDGGAGADQIVGGAGNDMIEAGAGDDTINGNSGNDTIRGGDGNDSIDGSVGNDLIYGDGGNDQILGSEGADAINGGLGDDNIVGGSENDTVLGLGGNDILVGGAGDDVLIGGDGDDKISGLGGIDKMAGNGGVDVLVGLASEIDEAFTELRFPFLM